MHLTKTNYLSSQSENIDGLEAEIDVFDSVDEMTGNIIYDSVMEETLRGQKKIVLKTSVGNVVLNVTNKVRLIDAFGHETSEWIGRHIKFKVEDVEFMRRKVKGLGIYPIVQEKIDKEKTKG